jgi:hypothetical protein
VLSVSRWGWAVLALVLLAVYGTDLLQRSFCMPATERCVTVQGLWVRVDSVERPGEIVLVSYELLRRSKRLTVAFWDSPLGLRGAPVSVRWGDAQRLGAPVQVGERRFEGTVFYLPACQAVISHTVAHRDPVVRLSC